MTAKAGLTLHAAREFDQIRRGEGPGRRNGDRVSVSPTAESAGTDATRTVAPSLGVIPPESLGIMVIVPPSDRTRSRGFFIMGVTLLPAHPQSIDDKLPLCHAELKYDHLGKRY